MPTNDNLKNLKILLSAMDADHLTKTDFVKHFEGVVNLVKKIEKKNLDAIDALEATYKRLGAKLQTDNTTTTGELKTLIRGELDNFNKKFGEKEQTIIERLLEVKSGKDADEEVIVGEVLKQIKLPEYKETVLDDATQLRNKLETLKGKDRLDQSAIKGLEKKLKELKAMIKKSIRRPIFGHASGTSGGRSVMYHDLSDSLDGTTKAFSLPAFWRVISIHSSSFPNAMRATIDYTTDADAMKITFTSEINAATTLAKGQTLIVVFAEQ